MSFRKINTLAGWFAGVLATLVYLLTIEPTASLWDCSEFIPAAYKLEISHAPGAPFLMLIQRIFSLFAFGNTKHVALCINAWSAIASGLTIVFLFWTITAFGEKMLQAASPDSNEDNAPAEPTKRQNIVLLAAGFCGALAYAFSDSFWFSAVEAEVYATSSLLTAMVFWCMLRWDKHASRPNADRWLLLIAFLIGISTGIHLLCLLAIPAMTMLYYFRRFPVSLKGGVIAFSIGCAALLFVQYGMIQGIPALAGSMDLFFVNQLGLPFDSGAIFSLILVAAAIVLLLRFTKKKGLYEAHTAILCIAFIAIGLLSYVSPVLRSRADVPVDMTNPDNARSLLSYVRRDMFGSQHLVYGRDFDATVNSIGEGDEIYVRARKNGKCVYLPVGKEKKMQLDPNAERLFPRLWSTSPEYARFYKYYLGLDEGQRPGTGDNLKFFFDYQVNWMWWRYFMWNFVGRQNDLPGYGDPKSGNWASGLPVIDRALSFGAHDTGEAAQMNEGLRHNQARNELFYLPLILGLAGLVFQIRRRGRDALVLGILYFFSSIAVVIYVNMSPLQETERDFAFAGSFYTFAIWIGLGIITLDSAISRFLKSGRNVYLTVLLSLPVPLLLACTEWNDHDRSQKTLARASAYNTLMSCAPNAVLFTNGDNYTYPLYYLQEVEGIRKDVRVVCSPLLLHGWYIDQLQNRINDAAPVPILWKPNEYLADDPDNLNLIDQKNAQADPANTSKNLFMPIKDFCRFVVSDKKITDLGAPVNYVPTRNISIPVPGNAEIRITFSEDKTVFAKNELAQLSIIGAIAEAGWNRPVYFTDADQAKAFGNLTDYISQEGTVYRLTPHKTTDSAMKELVAGAAGGVDLSKSYELFTRTFLWGGADQTNIYFDASNRSMLAPYRMAAARTAAWLVAYNRREDALRMLDAVSKGITESSYPYDVSGAFLAVAYYNAGGLKQAGALARKVVDNGSADMEYLGSLRNPVTEWLAREVQQNVGMMKLIAESAIRAGDKASADYAIQGIDATKNTGIAPVDRINQTLEALRAMQRGN
jgi:hypothetical protein